MKKRIALKVFKSRHEPRCRYRRATIWRMKLRLNHTPEAFKHRHRKLAEISMRMRETTESIMAWCQSLGMPKHMMDDSAKAE